MKKIIVRIIFLLLIMNLQAEQVSEKNNVKLFNQGVKFYKNEKYNEAIKFWKKISADSKYYNKAQKNIRIAEKKVEINKENNVLLYDELKNSNFEEGDGLIPNQWNINGNTKKTYFTWETNGGISNSRCISISSATNEYVMGFWNQSIKLTSFTPYILEGWIKGHGLQSSARNSGGFGVSWNVQNGPENKIQDLEWTKFKLDFVTGPNTQVSVSCILGYGNDKSIGKIYFDDLTLKKNKDVETFEGDCFIFHMYKDQIKSIGRDVVIKQVANIDKVCIAYQELTGNILPEIQSAYAPRFCNIGALGWSGNPTLCVLNQEWMEKYWPRKDYCAEIFLHELGHNYDHANWNFHGEFNELKMYFALETLGFAIAEDGWNKGKKTRHRWELRSKPNRENGIFEIAAQIYKNILIKDKIGWEPFKKTYRFFLSLSQNEIPETAWDKFKLWHDKLSEFSKKDVWSVYSKEELNYIKAYYAPRPHYNELPFIKDLSQTNSKISLANVRWNQAKVGWGNPIITLLGSGENFYPSAIYAHAPSMYSYQVNQEWNILSGIYGLRRAHKGSVVFVVIGDNKELFRSSIVKDFKERKFKIDIKNVKNLELIVEDGGDGGINDHGIWFEIILKK